MQMDYDLVVRSSSGELQSLTSTATSASPLPFDAPSTTAATISSRYFVSVSPSISLMSASDGPTRREDLSRLMSVVCFLSDESSEPAGPGRQLLRPVWRWINSQLTLCLI
jgi:hypothetical protein